MEKAEVKNFGKPEESRKFPHGNLELVSVAGSTVARMVYEPGWKWSDSIKPIAKTHSCQVDHLIYQLSGIMKIVMDDGTVLECKPGDISHILPGHDAWVVGDEPVVMLDFNGMRDYLMPH